MVDLLKLSSTKKILNEIVTIGHKFLYIILDYKNLKFLILIYDLIINL